MVEYFTDNKRGYKEEQNIKAVPYDWRLAAGEYILYIQ